MSTEICSGIGECLIQLDDLSYGDFRSIPCSYSCLPISCPNYLVCRNREPRWVLDCHSGLCANCDIVFGTWDGGPGRLKFSYDNCAVCRTTTDCVQLLYCHHKLCVGCFRKTHRFYDEKDDVKLMIEQHQEEDEIYLEHLRNDFIVDYVDQNIVAEEDEPQSLKYNCPICK